MYATYNRTPFRIQKWSHSQRQNFISCLIASKLLSYVQITPFPTAPFKSSNTSMNFQTPLGKAIKVDPRFTRWLGVFPFVMRQRAWEALGIANTLLCSLKCRYISFIIFLTASWSCCGILNIVSLFLYRSQNGILLYNIFLLSIKVFENKHKYGR